MLCRWRGTFNSAAQPAKPGSVVSFYVNGLGTDPLTFAFDVTAGPKSLEVVNVARERDFVCRVDVRLPADYSGQSIRLGAGNLPVGPLQLLYRSGRQGLQSGLQPRLDVVVWLAR